MSFFSRPNIDNIQFRQTSDSVLTLSGQTQIATTSGLTLTDGIGGFIPIILTGATDFNVLTYSNGKVTLQPSIGGSGGAIYSGASPTTCTVGGLVSGSTIYGSRINDILQSILVPTVNPVIVSPSGSFTINPTNVLYEVGNSISVTGCSVLNRGSITPAYCGTCSSRSGSAVCYEYNIWGSSCSIGSILPSNSIGFGSHPVTIGNNTLSSKIYYSSGCTPAYNSAGGVYSAALSSGSTSISTITISGIYPYFYGKVSSGNAPAGSNRPLLTAGLITGGTKVVSVSNNTICINFNSTYDDYIWFAIPNSSANKNVWFVNSLNNGSIGGVVSAGGNLFPALSTVTGVTTTCWSNQTYKLYVSNYQTAVTTIMELRNN